MTKKRKKLIRAAKNKVLLKFLRSQGEDSLYFRGGPLDQIKTIVLKEIPLLKGIATITSILMNLAISSYGV